MVKKVNKKLVRELLEKLETEKPKLVEGTIFEPKYAKDRKKLEAAEEDYKPPVVENMVGDYCAIGWLGKQLGVKNVCDANDDAVRDAIYRKLGIPHVAINDIVNNNDSEKSPADRRKVLAEELKSLAETGKLPEELTEGGHDDYYYGD